MSAAFSIIVTNCQIGSLWVHRPWNHTQDIAKMFVNGRVTDMSVRETLRKSLDEARSLENVAVAKAIRIAEPFTGLTDVTNHVLVLGPTKQYHESLLPEFRCTPEAKRQPGLLQKVVAGAGEVIKS